MRSRDRPGSSCVRTSAAEISRALCRVDPDGPERPVRGRRAEWTAEGCRSAEFPSQPPILSVHGSRRISRWFRRPVLLRGLKHRRLENMENFLTGYPGNESQHRQVLHRVPGPELMTPSSTRFMEVFYGTTDAVTWPRSG